MPAPRLVIRPSFALVCALGSVQFRASYIDENFIETDVTDQTTFQTSNPDIAVVGAASGNATGLSIGEAQISGSYLGLTGFTELTVLGGNCCDDHNVAMMVMVDRTRSMNQVFSPAYATKLDFAKAAARRFISEVNEQKDKVGLMTFTTTSHEILSPVISDKDAVADLVDSIIPTQQLTSFYDALSAAIDELNAVAADLKVLVLFSDGEDKDDSYSDADNPIALLTTFKDAGGIVMTIGVRAHDFGYNLLSAFSTGGFFLNGHGAVAQATLDYMSGLKGYICAGNCTPEGDSFEPSGTLNYCGLANWNVVDGHVDLMGNGFLDLLPGNGLYLDLAGSRAPYKGRLESKNTYALVAGKVYVFKLRLAGNQRVDDEPNTITVQAYARDTDEITNPVAPPVVGAAVGSGSAALETYEYSYAYVNANGETELSPVATGDNGGFSTFSNAVSGTPSGAATLVRFYKREQGSTTWYRVAESDPAAPAFSDTRSNAALAAAINDGAVDPCDHPASINSTGTPIYLFDQDIHLDDFRADFDTYHLEFEAAQTANVWLSIQQAETPPGYDAAGVLLDSVIFENVTDTVVLLDDDFDSENMVYVPPRCGLGTVATYGYASDGIPLIPDMTSNTDPSGVVSSGTSYTSQEDWWSAFDRDVESTWLGQHSGGVVPDTEWLQYQFAAAQTVGAYELTSHIIQTQTAPSSWIFQGSNNGTTWTTIDEREGITDWTDGVPKLFALSGPVSFSYFRFTFRATVGTVDTSFSVSEVQLYGSTSAMGYSAGYNCYGTGCLDEPPAVQSEDPSPLADNEVTGQPPVLFTASADVVRSCDEGSIYVPDTSLTPTSTTVGQCGTASIGTLDGLRMVLPVSTYFTDEWLGTCVDPPDQNVFLRGDGGTTYNVTLRFRGIVEGGEYDPAPTPIGTNVGGTGVAELAAYPDLAAGTDANAYYLITSNPAKVYALNYRAGAVFACYMLDATITIPINAASSVSLRMRSQDNRAFLNFVNSPPNNPTCDGFDQPGTTDFYCPGIVPGIINGGSAIPDSTPFPGQFIQMDVISVVPQ